MDYLERVPDKDASVNEELSMFSCIDCKVDTHKIHEYYMVKSDIWKEAKMEYDGGMLCIKCLEKRLGRELTKNDFNLDLPINRIDNPISSWNIMSDRLLKRLGYV